MSISLKSRLQKLAVLVMVAGGVFLLIINIIGNVEVMRDIWILLSKHFPVVSSMIAPFHAHPWIAVGLIVVLIQASCSISLR